VIVLIVSHVHFLREALIATLRRTDGIEAVGAFSRETAEAAANEFLPEVIVVDPSHPGAITLVTAVRARVPKARVIVLATRERDEDFLVWAEIGICGYLGPDASARDLVSMMHRAAAGEVVCPPRLTALLLSRFANHANDRAIRAGVHALTHREREVLELLAGGLSNKLIARRLGLSLATVKNHVHSILEKWDVHSRAEATARYRQQIQDGGPRGGNLAGLQPNPVPRAGHIEGIARQQDEQLGSVVGNHLPAQRHPLGATQLPAVGSPGGNIQWSTVRGGVLSTKPRAWHGRPGMARVRR